MDLLSIVTDNITEILVQVVEFTQARQKVLIRNINKMKSIGFVPEDVKVHEFCKSLDHAVREHLHTGRLVLCDTESIKFVESGSVEVSPVVDKYAKQLLEENPEQYLELQTNKILENSLNQRIAAELLRQRQEQAVLE